MKQLIISDKVQKEMLTDFMIMGETRGLIGGYCEDEFPVYYANEEMARMLGYGAVEELVEAINGKVINTIHPDDREQVIKDIGGEYYEGLTYETTYRMPRKDGSWFWTVDKGKVIQTEEGKLAIISACYDMTSFVERHKKLEEQNMLSQATIDNIPGGYHRCSLEVGNPFLYISDRFLTILGWTREEIKTIFDNKFDNMLHPDDRNLSADYTARILDTCGHGFTQDQIYRLLGKDGYHWVTDATTLVKSGNQTFFQGNITDITDFVKAKEKEEKELEDSNRILNERNRILSALSRDYTTVLLCDLKEDTFEVVKGDTFTHNTHTGKQHLVLAGNCYSERVRYFFENVLIKESAPEYLERLLPDHLMKELQETDSIEIYHKTIPNGTGSRHFLARAIRLSNEEDHFKIILVFYSVDEIMKKEQEIELQREIIEGLGKEYFSVLAVELDKDQVLSYRESGENGKIISDFCKKCGNRWSKIIPSYAETMVSDNTNGEFEKQLGLEALRSREEDYSMGYEFKSETGIKYYQVRVAYVKKKDGTRMAVVGTRNIDSLIKKERMQEEKLKKAYAVAENANKAKTEFLNNMSHDIRTPMNAIVGFTDIAMKRKPDKEVENCLKKIRQSSEYLMTLINDVLDISRIESGKLEYKPVPTDLRDMINTVLSIAKGYMENRDLNLYVSREKLKTPYVMADELRIREVLLNIISNAVKFTKDGGTISFAAENAPGNDENHIIVRYRISDTGIGMSEEFQTRIFDEFSQENGGARTSYKGAGLGMAIAKQYVDLMGGKIEVSSRKGIGSTFTVEIPLLIAEQILSEKEEKLRKDMDLHGLHVLLAEDNDLNAEIAVALLEEQGMIVTRTVDGKSALAQFCNTAPGTFDLILMDIMMPEMNGYETTTAIRNLPDRPDGKKIPIIAMTANAFAEDVQAALNAGMDDHVAKPIDMSILISVITKYIER